LLDESKRNLFLFFPEKFISLFAPSVSTVARVVASGKTIIYLSPTFSTVNGPYQISGQCLEGERNFFLFFCLVNTFIWTRQTSCGCFLSLYGCTLFSAFLTVGYLY
jgi:hypothetical protein